MTYGCAIIVQSKKHYLQRCNYLVEEEVLKYLKLYKAFLVTVSRFMLVGGEDEYPF